MIELARRQLKDLSIDFQVADVKQLPFSDDSFDRVVCQYGLMFLPDKSKGFQEGTHPSYTVSNRTKEEMFNLLAERSGPKEHAAYTRCWQSAN